MTPADTRTILPAFVLLTVVFAVRIASDVNRGAAATLDERVTLAVARDAAAPSADASQRSSEISEEKTVFARTLPAVVELASVSATIPRSAERPAALQPVSPANITDEERKAPAVGAIAGIAAYIGSADAPLWEKNGAQRWPTASLAKLMSAVIVDENVGHDKKITVAAEDLRPETQFHDVSGGETFSAGDLRAAMLLRSSNDAAYAIARFYGAKQFVDDMQRRAAEIGMADTAFFDPAGLSSLSQSTVGDLRILAEYIWQNHRDIFALSTRKEASILEESSATRRTIKSNNDFAGNKNFLGGKTGYTDEAHGNLLSLFDIGGKPLLIVVLGTDDRFGDTKKILDWTVNNE